MSRGRGAAERKGTKGLSSALGVPNEWYHRSLILRFRCPRLWPRANGRGCSILSSIHCVIPPRPRPRRIHRRRLPARPCPPRRQRPGRRPGRAGEARAGPAASPPEARGSGEGSAPAPHPRRRGRPLRAVMTSHAAYRRSRTAPRPRSAFLWLVPYPLLRTELSLLWVLNSLGMLNFLLRGTLRLSTPSLSSRLIKVQRCQTVTQNGKIKESRKFPSRKP